MAGGVHHEVKHEPIAGIEGIAIARVTRGGVCTRPGAACIRAVAEGIGTRFEVEECVACWHSRDGRRWSHSIRGSTGDSEGGGVNACRRGYWRERWASHKQHEVCEQFRIMNEIAVEVDNLG